MRNVTGLPGIVWVGEGPTHGSVSDRPDNPHCRREASRDGFTTSGGVPSNPGQNEGLSRRTTTMTSAVQGSRQAILVEGQSDEPHDELSCPARRRLRAQEARLGQQLRDELAPRRAEREPYGHLGRPNGGPRQQQVRDVGARDQENHGGDTEEEKPAFLERPSRPRGPGAHASSVARTPWLACGGPCRGNRPGPARTEMATRARLRTAHGKLAISGPPSVTPSYQPGRGRSPPRRPSRKRPAPLSTATRPGGRASHDILHWSRRRSDPAFVRDSRVRPAARA